MNDRNIWLHFNLHIFNDRGLQQGVSDLLRNKSILISDNLPAIVYQPYTPKTTVTEMGQQILIKKYIWHFTLMQVPLTLAFPLFYSSS